MLEEDDHLNAPRLSLDTIIEMYKAGKFSKLYVVTQDTSGSLGEFMFEKKPATAG